VDSLGGQKHSTEKEKDSFSKAVREENERDNVGKLNKAEKRGTWRVEMKREKERLPRGVVNVRKIMR